MTEDIVAVVLIPDSPDAKGDVVSTAAIAALDVTKIKTPSGTRAVILDEETQGIPKGSLVLVRECSS